MHSNFRQFKLPNRGTRIVVLFVVFVLADGRSYGESSIDAKNPVLSSIRLNTVGYTPGASKRATIINADGAFVIRAADSGTEVMRGPLVPLDDNGDHNTRHMIADFTDLDAEGDFRLEILGGRESSEFRIGSDVHNWPFYCATRAMYLWRCGTAVSGEFNGDHYHHEACHLDDACLDHVGGPAGKAVDGTGGWHDAGDYNKYTVNGAFTAGMMLKAWEHFGEQLRSLSLDIPESGNSVPDFLDELRWELDWLLKMQADDGRVYHKLSTIKFGDFIPPEDETKRRYFSPWGSAATADFVAVMAQASRVFRPFDEEFAKRCLAAATKSYNFLQENSEDHRPDISAFETGPYDAPDADDREWAAAEMWETTGDAKYLRDFEQRVSKQVSEPRMSGRVVDIDWDWSDVDNLGKFTYLLSKRSGRDGSIVARVRADTIRAADQIVNTSERHAYGRPLGSRYYWGCNGTVARQTMNLHVAHRLTDEPRYRAAMCDALNHLFGRNPFGRSYVTGLGYDPPMYPHDRRSGGDDVAAPWPGYLIGGPWPNATDWYDVEEDYRTNETAINWNGALIYALAAFVEPQTFEASVAAGRRARNADAAGE
jgi:endoglucanase